MRRLWAIAALLAPLLASAFDLQGHRGARGLAPENTLPAFAAALAIGVTTLELDTGVTKDGVVVIHHDRRLNPDLARGPDGRWVEAPAPLIHNLSFEELQRYDVGRLRPGSPYAQQFHDQQPADGVRVPRLEELFDLVKKSGNDTVRFNIETKLSPLAPEETLPPLQFARALLAEIRKAGVESRTSIQSFDWRTLRVVEREAAEIATVYLTGRRGGESQPKAVNAAGGRIWSPNHEAMDSAAVVEARALGLKIIPWTVNEPAAMQRVIALGVDGMISDRPDLLRSVLEANAGPWRRDSPLR